MAIEIGTGTKIIAGVGALLVAAAGGWFFLFQEDAPPPKTVVAPPKSASPAADAAKTTEPTKGDAVKAADAGKVGEAPKPAADAAKPAADAPKQASAAPAAAPAAKPAPVAKPAPGSPDQLVAEVVEASGVKTNYQPYAREILLRALVDQPRSSMNPADVKSVSDMTERALEPGKVGAAVAARLKTGLDAERMARFLDVLRLPSALKMSQELRNATPEAVAEFSEKTRASPLSGARAKMIQSLDDITRYSETGVEFATAAVRAVTDKVLGDMQKGGKNVSKEARQQAGSALNTMRGQMRAQSRMLLQFAYRNASDQELAESVKQLDTDTGRWGMERLSSAAKPILAEIGSGLGNEGAQIWTARRTGAMAKKAPAPAPEPVAKAPAEAPAAKAEIKAAAAPAAPVGYQRGANTRVLYTRYNDLITATVMRDRDAVKELLDDGKSPNVRQADGSTPLMIAVANNDAATASMLLAKGADPNLRAGNATALSIARSRGAAGAEMVQLLQRGGAKE